MDNYFYFYVHTAHFDELIFIITTKNAHIIGIKLYYYCSILFLCSRTIFEELILLTSSLHTPNQDLNYIIWPHCTKI
jgi:hypothetical protein